MSAMLPITLGSMSTSGTATLLGVLAAVFLLILLVARELLNVYEAALARRSRVLDIAIFPLLFVFALIVIEQFYRLIFL
jgi:hypothetical protein